MPEQLESKAKTLQKELVSFRRYLHEQAETGFDLPKSRAFIQEKLQTLGLECEEKGGSVVATLTLGQGSRCILLRADMDGLPIQEQSGEKFACKTGNMHACGHDLHAAMLYGAACLLKGYVGKTDGKVKFLFQAAEERLEGAKAAIENGVLENPKPQAAAMIHVMTDSPLKTGTAVVAENTSAPAADYFRIEIQGKGCHGSAPQNGVDALSVAAHCLVALHELSARELSAQETAVLTVGTLRGGEAANAIADKAVMEGTLRAFDEDTRAFMKKRLSELPVSIAKAFRAQAKTTFTSGCPTLVNAPRMSALALTAAQTALKEKAYLSTTLQGGDTAKRSGGSEDFAYISHEIPSVMVGLAAGERENGYDKPLHHPKARFDENALSCGAALYAQIALQWLQSAQKQTEGIGNGKGKKGK
jgi:hippurate hydrolase